MSTIDTLREYAEVWRLFGSMPDDATLSAEVSALYLGARNQRVNYLLGDLRTWRDHHKVNSTMEAAQIRGLAFASLTDFTKPEPFWTIDNKIYSHALTVSDEVFKELLNTSRAEVIWISLEKVLFENWHTSRERQKWNDVFVRVLSGMIKSCEVEQERHILNDIL